VGGGPGRQLRGQGRAAALGASGERGRGRQRLDLAPEPRPRGPALPRQLEHRDDQASGSPRRRADPRTVREERTPEARRAFQQRQADSVIEYRELFAETWGEERTPYVVTSRTAYPGATTDAALAEAGEKAGRWNEFAATIGRVDADRSVAEQLLSDNFIWGDAEALAADLLDDPTVLLSDEIVLGIHPALHTIDETIDKAEALIEEVVPRLRAGWDERRHPLLRHPVLRHGGAR
jgi:hypothetical protein